MDKESNNKIVEMHAVFRTDGSDEKRERVVRQEMDIDKILGATTLEDAIEYFKSQVSYIDSIEDFAYLVIDGETFEADFWK